MDLLRVSLRFSALLLVPAVVIGFLAGGTKAVIGALLGIVVADLILATCGLLVRFISPKKPGFGVTTMTILFEFAKLPILGVLIYAVCVTGTAAIAGFLCTFVLVYSRLVFAGLQQAKPGQQDLLL